MKRYNANDQELMEVKNLNTRLWFILDYDIEYIIYNNIKYHRYNYLIDTVWYSDKKMILSNELELEYKKMIRREKLERLCKNIGN